LHLGRQFGARGELYDGGWRVDELARALAVTAGGGSIGFQPKLARGRFWPPAGDWALPARITPEEGKKSVLAGVVVEGGFFQAAEERNRFRLG